VAERAAAGSPHLLLVLATLFWAGNFVLARAMHDDIPPLAMAFWRWTLAAALLLPFGWPRVRAQWDLVRPNLPVLLVLGLLGVAGFNALIYTALTTTTATNAVLLNAAMPSVIVVLSWGLLDERVSRVQALGLVVSFAGVMTIVARGDPAALRGLSVTPGDLWVLGAVLCWSAYTVLLRWRPPGLDPVAFLSVIVPVGCVVLLPLFLWERAGGVRITASGAVFLSLAYFAVFPSLVSYLCWNRAVAKVGPSRAGVFINLMPLFGTVLAVVFLGERPQPFHAVGIVLVLGGIFLTARRQAGMPLPDQGRV
jgi:drug/metabolite transporter (DMT)-like permease